jgi:phage terminase small subunit
MARVKNKWGNTPKMEEFCNLFVFGDEKTSGNATQCYRKAYNVGKATKDATINRSAHELMKNPNISARIEHLQDELSGIYKTDAETTRKRIVNRLWEIADQDNSQSVNALRLLAQQEGINYFQDQKITTNQNISLSDATDELNAVINNLIDDNNVIRLFSKETDAD